MMGDSVHGTAASSATVHVPDEWLEVNSELEKLVRARSGIMGISVGVYPGCMREAGAPALWSPSRKELLVDPEVAMPGEDPGTVEVGDPLWQAEHPLLQGLVYHEIGHAVGSVFTTADYIAYGASRRRADVLALLEEPYCESAALFRIGRPAAKFLRASALDIMLRDFATPDTPYGAAAVAALVLARVDAGVLSAREAAQYRDIVLQQLSADQLGSLTGIWREYLAGAGGMDVQQRIALAGRWLDVLGEDESADSPVSSVALSGGAPVAGRAQRAAREHSGRVDRDFTKARRKIRSDREQTAAAELSQLRTSGAQAGATALSPGGEGRGAEARRSYRTGTRVPTTEERRGMVVLAERLEQADFRGRGRGRRPGDSPPGRITSRAMDLDSAAERGEPPQRLDVFSVKHLVPDARPPLTVGLMTDVSGSMVRAADALCTTQWMLSNAVDRIGGRVASMFFGVRHYEGLRPGERHDEVDVWAANDGFEMPYPALGALEARLGLFSGEGPRLLVVATDAKWSQNQQVKKMRSAMGLARRQGLHVIWATFTGVTARAEAYGTGEVLDLHRAGPVEAAAAIGDAAIRLVRDGSE